jgi:alpha-tubulin suppressor-like RCC1 family protein
VSNSYGSASATSAQTVALPPAGSTPVQVKGVGGTGTLSNATQISAGGAGPMFSEYQSGHTCALLSGGTVACWGANAYGQLGDGTTTSSPIPVQVKGVGGTGSLSNVIAISAGRYHTCALVTGGTVECWGDNFNGQLGNGAPLYGANSTTPVQVKDTGGTNNLTGVSQISAGGSHTCAVLSDQTVSCWGDNAYGQLGSG